MQTRCPACQTLYRIDEDVLKRAGGQARCFRCDTVFDAYRNPAQDLAGDDVDDDALEPGGDSEGLSELSALAELPDVPSHSAVEPDSELDLNDLAESLRRFDPEPLESDAADFFNIGEARDAATGGDRAAAVDLPDLDDRLTDLDEAADALPGIEIDEAPSTPPPPEPVSQARPAGSHGFAIAVAVLLAVAALVQLGWFNREQVLATPQGQGLAEVVCGIVDCDLPPRRAPSRYAVLDRKIEPDPEHAGALLLHLSFRNGADFAQPLPDIQLTLYDSEEKLMARRRLHPHEYLFPAPSPDTRVGEQEVVQVTVKLEDPGRHATGFKLEFL